MNDPNLQPAEPTGYRATAAEFRRLAEAFETLGDLPPGEQGPYLSFGFVLKTVAGADAVSRAVLGKDATTEKRSDSWMRIAVGGPQFGRGYYHVQASVQPPPDERDAELAVLRAEVEQLRAAKPAGPTAQTYARAQGPEDGELTQPGGPPTDPVTRYFTFGDPERSGQYVSVTAATADRCRLLMVEAYGIDWCDEYADLPGDYEWIENNRIVEWEL